MGTILSRHLAGEVVEALGNSRIVNVVGPRQAGKSTLIRKLVPIVDYLTMDNDPLRDAVKADPYGTLRGLADRHKGAGRPIALDEVQRVPEITLALKRIVDDDDLKGQFLLTGSANVFGLEDAGDSLAGRVSTLRLHPLSAAEVYGVGPCRLLDAVDQGPQEILSALPPPRPYSRDEAIDIMVRGGYPEFRHLDDRARCARHDSYVDSIIVKDVPVVSPVRKPQLLRSLINQLAHRTGQELAIESLTKATGARRETLLAWLDTLERLCLIHRLPGWRSSGTGKDVGRPKLHMLDTGVATALRGETSTSFAVDADPSATGAVLESFVFAEILKSLDLAGQRWDAYHWREKDREIDLVVQRPGRCLALFEVKASATVSPSDFKHIDWFLESGPGKAYAQRSVGFVVYLGDRLLSMGHGKICLPLSMFWSFPK